MLILAGKFLSILVLVRLNQAKAPIGKIINNGAINLCTVGGNSSRKGKLDTIEKKKELN